MDPLPLFLPLLLQAASKPGLATETRTLKVGDEPVNAYFTRPAGKGLPALVVVHEWWGVNDQVKGVADSFAREGYAAIVPDLYAGKVATGEDLAHELMRGLEDAKAVKVLRAAVASLRADPSVDGSRIGILGFCMGGGFSLLAALEEDAFSAAVVCYGKLVTDPDRLKSLKCPVLGVFGEKDQGIPPKSVKEFEEAAKVAAKEVTCKVFPGVGHAFLNEGRPGYKPEVAERAWREIREFLGKRLRKS